MQDRLDPFSELSRGALSAKIAVLTLCPVLEAPLVLHQPWLWDMITVSLLICELWTSVSGDAQWHTMIFSTNSRAMLSVGLSLAWHEASHSGQLVYHEFNGQ